MKTKLKIRKKINKNRKKVTKPQTKQNQERKKDIFIYKILDNKKKHEKTGTKKVEKTTRKLNKSRKNREMISNKL